MLYALEREWWSFLRFARPSQLVVPAGRPPSARRLASPESHRGRRPGRVRERLRSHDQPLGHERARVRATAANEQPHDLRTVPRRRAWRSKDRAPARSASCAASAGGAPPDARLPRSRVPPAATSPWPASLRSDIDRRRRRDRAHRASFRTAPRGAPRCATCTSTPSPARGASSSPRTSTSPRPSSPPRWRSDCASPTRPKSPSSCRRARAACWRPRRWACCARACTRACATPITRGATACTARCSRATKTLPSASTCTARCSSSTTSSLTIGSANLANRSMCLDTECNLAIEARRRSARAGRDRAIARPPHGRASRRRRADDVLRATRKAPLHEAIAALREPHRRHLERIEPAVDPAVDAIVPDHEVIDPDGPLDPEVLIARPSPRAAHAGASAWARRGRDCDRAGASGAHRARLARIRDSDSYSRWTSCRPWASEIRASPWAPLCVIGVFVASGLALVPVTLMIALTAALFGPVAAVPLSLTGALASGAVTFGLGRVLERRVVREIAGKRLTALSEPAAPARAARRAARTRPARSPRIPSSTSWRAPRASAGATSCSARRSGCCPDWC